MLKITAIGNLTNDVTLKTNETTGKPYANHQRRPFQRRHEYHQER